MIEEEVHFTHIRRRILKTKSPIVVNLNLDDNYHDDESKPIALIVDASGLTNNIKSSVNLM
jgi:hypothetical protein